MGWLFLNNRSKSDLVTELTATEESEARRWETVAHCVRGNVLWTVVDFTDKAKAVCKRVITCHLLERGADGRSWGYKSMDESVHPYYYSCPLKYLEMAPDTANEDWRIEVRRYHADRAPRKVKKGQKVQIVGSAIPWVVIRSLRPLLGEYDGQVYKVPRRALGDVICS